MAIDPTRRFGRPVLERANIETSVVAERYFAGEDPVSIASDLDIELGDVHEAVRFENQLHAA